MSARVLCLGGPRHGKFAPDAGDFYYATSRGFPYGNVIKHRYEKRWFEVTLPDHAKVRMPYYVADGALYGRHEEHAHLYAWLLGLWDREAVRSA